MARSESLADNVCHSLTTHMEREAETSALKVKQSSYINFHFHPLETSRTIKVDAFTLNTLFLPLTLTQKGKSFFRVISLAGEGVWGGGKSQY